MSRDCSFANLSAAVRGAPYAELGGGLLGFLVLVYGCVACTGLCLLMSFLHDVYLGHVAFWLPGKVLYSFLGTQACVVGGVIFALHQNWRRVLPILAGGLAVVLVLPAVIAYFNWVESVVGAPLGGHLLAAFTSGTWTWAMVPAAVLVVLILGGISLVMLIILGAASMNVVSDICAYGAQVRKTEAEEQGA